MHLVAYSDNTDTADQTLLFMADNWGRDATPGDPTTILTTASTDSWAEINPNQPSEPTARTRIRPELAN